MKNNQIIEQSIDSIISNLQKFRDARELQELFSVKDIILKDIDQICYEKVKGMIVDNTRLLGTGSYIIIDPQGELDKEKEMKSTKQKNR